MFLTLFEAFLVSKNELYSNNINLLFSKIIKLPVDSKLQWINNNIFKLRNLIGGVMVKLLASSEVDRGFEPQSVQTNDNKIGTCYFSNKYPASNRKCKDWLARNQDKVSQ